jgi:predicted nucleic acid-binding Zn ribbon protein
MPTFIMNCQKCNAKFDFYKLRKSSKARCPKCGNENEKDFVKLPTAPAISFKGEGWQTTNYSASVDPTSVPGVKKIEKEEQTLDQKTLYKHRKEVTGRRKKVKVKGLPEVRRKFEVGKA